MKRSRRSVFVYGKSYPVFERSGYIKADLGGVLGWTSVWAETTEALVRRIKTALAEGQ